MVRIKRILVYLKESLLISVMGIKICVCGSHGVGKSTICKKIFGLCHISERELDMSISRKKVVDGSLKVIEETFRHVIEQANLSSEDQKNQSESLTLATYGYQLYQEHLYNLQGKNIICDRAVIDCMVYNDYHNKTSDKYSSHYLYAKAQALFHTKHFYDRVYLIEPSDRPIDNDGFRLTDKESQREVHNLFLECIKDFRNVVVVNQEQRDDVVNEVVNLLV